MKTNEKFIEFIFISFTMYYTCLSVTFLANNVWGKFSYFIFPTESRPKQKRSTDVERFFRVAVGRQELALVRTTDARKNKALLPQGCFCFGR